MSTAPADTSSDQPQRTSQQPGPLALLAATAIGGVLATRMGKAPFFLAAGAAAIALLKHKKTGAPPPAPAHVPLSLPPPAPELDIPAQSLVEQWLSRQIIREEQAPVVELSAADVTPCEPEDDYHPESFLLDDAEELFREPPDHDSFARLTEPAPQAMIEPVTLPAPEIEIELEYEEALPAPPPPLLQEPEVEVEEEDAPYVVAAPAPHEPEFPLPHLLPHLPPTTAGAAWTLGVEPLPSLSEAAPYVPPYVPPAGSLFFSAPVRQEDVFSAPVRREEAPRPVFSSPMFQGAAFPDEINVAPAALEPVPAPAPAPAGPAPPAESFHLPEPEPVNQPPPAAETTPEIPLELASPGDASFDPPLAALSESEHPWHPGQDIFATTPAFPVFPTQTHTTSPAVEAEIILRPRAPTQNTVTAKSKFAPPGFGKHFPADSSDTPSAEGTDDAHFPGPLHSPHEPKSRPTWRSWWRGD